MSNDGSRIEAAEAGVHAERDEHAAHDHVDATDAVPGAGSDGSDGHDAHHDDDGHGGGHGHADDPNADVVRGEAPTPAWLMTVTAIALVTIAACIWLAFRIG